MACRNRCAVGSHLNIARGPRHDGGKAGCWCSGRGRVRRCEEPACIARGDATKSRYCIRPEDGDALELPKLHPRTRGTELLLLLARHSSKSESNLSAYALSPAARLSTTPRPQTALTAQPPSSTAPHRFCLRSLWTASGAPYFLSWPTMEARANMCIAEAGAKAKNRPVSQSPPLPLGPLTQRQGSMTEDKMLVFPSTGSSSTFPRIGVQVPHRPALGSLIVPLSPRDRSLCSTQTAIVFLRLDAALISATSLSV